MIKISMSCFLQPTWDLGSGGTSSSDFLCLQDVNISDLEFREAHSGLKNEHFFTDAQFTCVCHGVISGDICS